MNRHTTLALSMMALLALGVISIGGALAQTPLERGSYLVKGILACGNCHTPKDAQGAPIVERELSGGLSFTTPAFDATASNITPDRETGIGAWSDEAIKRAITHGVRPDNARLPAPLAAVMAANFFKAFLPTDLDAIVVYLRSVKPIRNSVPGPVYKAPVHRDAYPDAEAGFTAAQMKDPVRRGAYLVTIGHCMECHSTSAKGISDYENGLGRGGRQFSPKLVQGFPATWDVSTAANITSHHTKGIGAWTDAEITRAIADGVSRDGRKLKPPMDFGSYRRINNSDLNAIVGYLRTVPPRD